MKRDVFWWPRLVKEKKQTLHLFCKCISLLAWFSNIILTCIQLWKKKFWQYTKIKNNNNNKKIHQPKLFKSIRPSSSGVNLSNHFTPWQTSHLLHYWGNSAAGEDTCLSQLNLPAAINHGPSLQPSGEESWWGLWEMIWEVMRLHRRWWKTPGAAKDMCHSAEAMIYLWHSEFNGNRTLQWNKSEIKMLEWVRCQNVMITSDSLCWTTPLLPIKKK